VQTIQVETLIKATPERCFDLARDMGVHERTTGGTGERVVEVVRNGACLIDEDARQAQLELGDVVTFEARHLGIRRRLTSKIVSFERPREFVDEMQKGAFKTLRHIHRFEETETGTRMVDVLEFESPLWIFGRIADAVFLKGYMTRFIASRGRDLRTIAEEPI